MKKTVIGMAFIMSFLTLSLLTLSAVTFFGATESKADSVLSKTKEYRYFVERGGGVEIREYIGKKKKVTVPAKIDGKDVVSVGGFSGTNVTSVTIPDSVTSIGNSVFAGCEKLKKAKLSKKIKTIPCYAFSGCNSLTTIKMSDKVSIIEDNAFANCGELKTIGNLTLTEVGRSAFKNCKKLAGTFTLDSSIEEIPDDSFNNCKKLTFRIPDKDLKVGVRAFAGCPGISEKYISPDIHAGAYAGCTNIDTVIIKDDNVVEENGIYYSKDRIISLKYRKSPSTVQNVSL